MPNNNSFSKNLVRLLRENHISQKELAEKLGVRPSTVSMWITGNSSPRMGIVQQISNILSVSMSDLLELNHDNSKRLDLQMFAEPPCSDTLLETFEQLNNLGKGKAIAYLEDIAGNPKYTK